MNGSQLCGMTRMALFGCAQVHRKGQSLLVRAIGEIRERDPTERIGEKSGHLSFLGQP